MNKYLEGYLSSIPTSEYANIIEFLQKYASKKLNISEEQFQILINSLTQDKQPTIKRIETKPDERPKDTYNQFFSGASIDLLYLFKVIDSLYSGLDSYSYLSSSYFSDIKTELDKLESKIKDSKSKREYSSNTIIVTENFKTTKSFEDYNNSTEYLFTDRDGSPLVPVDIVHNNTDDMISLAVKKEIDLLHNTDGKTTGKIEVLDFRGVPADTYSGSKYAIDSSDNSYWDCTTYSVAPIDVLMDDLEAGGAYIKFKLMLSKANRISEISLSPFCAHPVDICKIIIDGQDIISNISNPISTSIETMTFNFEPMSADEIDIVIRQKNYIYDIVTTNAKRDEANELWNAISNMKKESFINEPISPLEYKEENIYNKYMQTKEKEISLWNKNYIKEKE